MLCWHKDHPAVLQDTGSENRMYFRITVVLCAAGMHASEPVLCAWLEQTSVQRAFCFSSPLPALQTRSLQTSSLSLAPLMSYYK